VLIDRLITAVLVGSLQSDNRFHHNDHQDHEDHEGHEETGRFIFMSFMSSLENRGKMGVGAWGVRYY
jgi:hypothetical protein